MELIIFSCGILIIAVQVIAILAYVKNGEPMQYSSDYSQETIEKARIVSNAIRKSIIKKHIITNSAPKYNSKKKADAVQKFSGI